jgi:uncharacterized protein YigE (DUF2233 family)
MAPMTSLRHGLLAAATLLAATILHLQAAHAEPCAPQSFEGSDYIVCTVDAGKADLRLFWKNENGEPHRYFSSVAGAVEAGGGHLVFALNAGMYRQDFSPMGLYVENGKELRPANRAKTNGAAGSLPNFYKKPNGVFFLDGEGAKILPTDDFLNRRPAARFATQSGPMLVISGALNPIFIPGSTDRTRRGGVGICGGSVRFAISEGDVNFHDFARLFRDLLQCQDALFLDGGHGVGLYDPALGRDDRSWHGGYGPILGLVE